MQLSLETKRRGAVSRIKPAGAAASLLAAAACLLPETGQAQSAPEDAVLSFKYLDYIDLQKSGRRMRIHAPMLHALLPVNDRWSFEGAWTLDSMSGASPRYYSALSGASGKGIRDVRRAGDLRVTHHREDLAVGVGLAESDEDDYRSQALSLDLRYSTPNRNTTWAVAVAGTRDSIGSTNDVSLDEKRHTQEFLVGVTQVLSPLAVVQSNLTFTASRGFHSDPYKSLDSRPEQRHARAWLTRLNRFFPQFDAALQTSYRYFRDDWGVRAHAIEAAWHQNLPDGWALRPSLRYYTQSAADFFGDEFPPRRFDGHLSFDQRLSSFGAWTMGIKATKALTRQTSIDIKFEQYEQRSQWSLFRTADVPIEPFRYRLVMMGLSYRF